jgi:hypothetical protein
MNSSDLIARQKAKVIYTDLLAKFKSITPNNDCSNLCNCTSTNCKKHFQSYQLKQDFTKGMKECPCAPEHD